MLCYISPCFHPCCCCTNNLAAPKEDFPKMSNGRVYSNPFGDAGTTEGPGFNSGGVQVKKFLKAVSATELFFDLGLPTARLCDVASL